MRTFMKKNFQVTVLEKKSGKYVPSRGDIVWLSFNPQSGYEQSGHRPAWSRAPWPGGQGFRAIGGRAPLHLTSVGKLFLASDDPSQVRAYVTRTGLSGHTRNSITDLSKLDIELNQVRQLGSAKDNEELELGVSCVAASILDDTGKLVAGLSLSAPTDRIQPDWLRSLQETALQISKGMGYKPKAFEQNT